MCNTLQYYFRYLVYCTDLVALTEAKEIVEGDDFDDIVGTDDGKLLLKVVIYIKKHWKTIICVPKAP